MSSTHSPADGSGLTRVATTDVELACLTSASIDDRDRPLVVCAHGFPDTAQTWRHLMPALDDAGFRAVAPFLRGYAPSDVPADGCVQTGASATDLIALHDHFGGDDRAVVVGHDWVHGSRTARQSTAPDRWSRVVGLALPPGAALGAAFLTNTDQLKRSWYIFFFLNPLSDMVVAADDLAFLDMIWNDWSPGYDAADDLALVKDSLRDPANLSAALGYYRATLADGPTRDEFAAAQEATSEAPTQPMLYLHGANDGCIGAEVAEAARAMTGDNISIDVLADVGHFLHLEAPDVINPKILEFLS